MVYKIFFCSKDAFVLDETGRKMRRRRKSTHTNAKYYAFHAKAIIYFCALFD